MGTHEDLLNEILLGRTNQEIFLLKEAYRRTYNKDLVQIVQGELSMKTERCAYCAVCKREATVTNLLGNNRMFNMALSGQRDESPYLNHQLVQQDVETLYRAGPGKIGTVCSISPNLGHLLTSDKSF